ncbi:hypothetical protein A2U01_0032662, partial [Trifolium medium]|nr:hypothetical protein [Trifolium medium]
MQITKNGSLQSQPSPARNRNTGAAGGCVVDPDAANATDDADVIPPILAWHGKLMEHLVILRISVGSSASLPNRTKLLRSESENRINYARWVIDLNSTHIGCEVIIRASESVG